MIGRKYIGSHVFTILDGGAELQIVVACDAYHPCQHRVGNILRHSRKAGYPATDNGGNSRGQEPCAHQEADEFLRHEFGNHGKAQTTDEKLANGAQEVGTYQPPGGYDTGFTGEVRRETNHEEGTCRQQHTERKFCRHGQILALAAKTGIKESQNRAGEHNPERIEGLEHLCIGNINALVHYINRAYRLIAACGKCQ